MIKYEKKYLTLIKDLSAITPSIIFEKDGDDIVVRRSNDSSTIIYGLTVHKSCFDFEGDEIAFYNYPEFYQLISAFDKPELSKTEDDKIIISENKTKIKYKVSDSEVLKRVRGKAQVSDPEAEITLSVEQLDKIKKMISLISAERIKFKFTEGSDEVICTFFNLSHGNSTEDVYTLDAPSKESFDITIDTKVFLLIPRNSYNVSIKEEGVMKFKYIDDIFNLEIVVPSTDD